ncbi:glycosyltransferase [Herbaspirillum sp. alder98]|uniref:glycosyltransferase n=1 Tax=Herbaspirillum sp. alder98 TaxID=2913096 RepID=UPI001CD90468|nr:glycosyltransferase [Herbaspirillum sp. alder98]MCA1322659.1 glycosyltransferase [Herbaspirillum sp. alder98]
MTALLFLLAAVCILLAIHPFITYPLSLLLLRAAGVRDHHAANATLLPLADSSKLRFGICVCAYNEEKVIADTITRLIALRQAEPDLEILVHVDFCSDRTPEIARQFESQLDGLLIADRRRGKTEGMNRLVAMSKADILCFTDASVEIDAQAFAHFRQHFADPEVGAVCGKQVFTDHNGSVNAASNALYWRIEEKIKQLESDIGSIMTLDGSLYALRKPLRHAPPEDIVDDFFIPFMIMADGYRVIQSQHAKSSEPSVTNDGEEMRRKIRIAAQGFNAHRTLWPVISKMSALTLYMYLSHKFIRWFGIVFLVLGWLLLELALVASGTGWLALALLVVTALTLVLGLKLRIKPFSTVTNILMAFVGAGLGVWQGITGARYQVWEPPTSARKAKDK